MDPSQPFCHHEVFDALHRLGVVYRDLLCPRPAEERIYTFTPIHLGTRTTITSQGFTFTPLETTYHVHLSGRCL